MSLWSRGYTRLLLLGASPVLTFYGKAKVEKLRNALAAETPTLNWVSYHLAVATQNLFNSYFHYVLQNSQNKPCCEDYQV